MRETIARRSVELGLPPPELYGELDEATAVAHQVRLAGEIVESRQAREPHQVVGVDTAVADETGEMFASAVVVDVASGEVVEVASASGTASFAYVPGLLSFREIPLVCLALERLSGPFDMVLCDGHGRLHPRRFGLACHLGLLLDLPSFGVGKTHLLGTYARPAEPRGSFTPICDGGEVVGRLLRTRDQVRPVFVSIGHRTDLDQATGLTLGLASRFRLPEPTRRADIEANRQRRVARGLRG